MSAPEGGQEGVVQDGGQDERAMVEAENEAGPEGKGEALAGTSENPSGSGSVDPDDPAMAEEELPPLVAVLEAALFASAEPVPLTRLTRVLGAWTRKQVVAGLAELAERQEREESGLRVVEAGGGFQLRSVAEYAPWVRKFFAQRPPRLSRAVLETVAVIAYRQPSTRGEIEAVRGVNCDAVLTSLTTRGLIEVSGRRESPGRPIEYSTTNDFLELFGLRNLRQLPPLPNPSSLADLVDAAEILEEGAEEGAETAGGDGKGGESIDGVVEPVLHGQGAEEQSEQGVAVADDSSPAGSEDRDENHGPRQRETAEDSESGRDRLPTSSGGLDSRGSSPGERPGGPRVGGEG